MLKKCDVDQWISETKCLAFLTSSENKQCSIDYYRCSQVIRTKSEQCPVRAKVEKPANDLVFRVYHTAWEHEHADGSEKIPEDIIKEIIAQHRQNIRPVRIFDYITERFGQRFSGYNISQMRYIIRKHVTENIPQTVNVGDLVSFIKANRKVPKDLDTPFVLSFTQSTAQNTFNAIFSTLRLLSHAESEIWSADTTYQTNWQGYPLNITGAYDRIGQFHLLALGLSTNEKTDDYAMLFDSVKSGASLHLKMNVNPKFIMSDAANQISNDFKYTFRGVEEHQFWNLMCEFHVMKSINAFAFNSIDNKTEIKADIKTLQYCANPTVFSHAVDLFLEKWEEKEKEFCEYFRMEWVVKHPNWFAAANLSAPNTNNAAEGLNSSVKSVHTMRRCLPVTQFKQVLVDMLEYKSKMYVRKGEQKVFEYKPKIGRDDWSKAAQYAMDQSTKSKVFKHGEFYYILSNDELDKKRVHDAVDASNLFLNKEAQSFEEYKLEYHQHVYELDFKQDWTNSTCSCIQYMNKLMCKHVLAVALLKRVVVCPPEANPALLGQKPKRGRKPNSKGALIKPN